MPYIGRDLNRGNYLKLDDISSSFDSSTTTFNLTVGGSAFMPGSAFSILVSVGGVIQEPESAYQVNNSEITFANAPTAQDSFFCIALGVALGVSVPANGTVNGPQMAKPFNYDGFFYLDDANNRVGINSSVPSVALDVSGNAKISGILTAGSYSGSISNPSGISTFYDLRVTNNLTVEGSTTTLDTDLTAVDRVEVDANSNSIVGVAITQSGTADIINLFDGGTEVLTVTDGGKVGIGVTNPTKKLQIGAGTADSDNVITLGKRVSCSESNLPKIGHHSDNGSSSGLALCATSSSGMIHFFTGNGGNGFGINNNAERMRIKADGVVGIGSTIPDKKLSIVSDGEPLGISLINGTEFATAGIYLEGGRNAGTGVVGQLEFYNRLNSGVTSKLTVNGDGNFIFNKNVGVGTSNPTETFDVAGGNLAVAQSLTVNRPRIVLSAPDDSTGYRHLFGANLKVDSSGTFTTPSANISGGGWLYRAANSLNQYGELRYLSAPDTNSTSATTEERFRITAGGTVNIGGDYANTTGKLKVTGTTTIDGNLSVSQKIVHTGDTDTLIEFATDTITFETAGSERLRITSGGQVAIGTITAETNFLTTINGDLSLGEKNGADNTFIDQKQDGDLHIINSGRTSNGGSGTPGTAGVGINRYNTLAGGTTYFRDFTVYDGKDSKVLCVDGSAGAVGIGTDNPTAKLSVGRVTGGYMNADGIQVNRPHSLGLKNGIIVYSDNGYNPTASYRAAAFKAVGTTGAALGISTDQGSNGLGGTLNARIGFEGGGYFLGNIGIGTDNPGAQSTSANNLVVADFGGEGGITIKTNVNSAGNIFFADTAGSATGRIAYGHGATDAGDYMRFYVNSEERLRIRYDGKVGIGTINPSVMTHIYDKSNTTANTELFRISGGNRTAATFETGFRFFARSPSTNGNRHVRFTSNGNTGLEIQPIETSTGNAAVDRNILLCPDGGKVGIGTDNPTAKFEISHNVPNSVKTAGWLDLYDTQGMRIFHATRGTLGIYTQEQGDWSSGIVLGTIDGSTTRKWGIGMASNAKSTYGSGFYIGYRADSDNTGQNTLNTMIKSLILPTNGHVIVERGNLVLGANDKGISFANSSSSPDTDSTSSTRVMTDYDEGTCDWELHRSDGLTTGSNHSDSIVTYTKIGNRVFMSGYVYTASTGSSTNVTARLTDGSGNPASLPYTPNHHGIMPIGHSRTIADGPSSSGTVTDNGALCIGFESGSKTVYLHTNKNNNEYKPVQNDVSITSAQTHLVIVFTGSYRTSE